LTAIRAVLSPQPGKSEAAMTLKTQVRLMALAPILLIGVDRLMRHWGHDQGAWQWVMVVVLFASAYALFRVSRELSK
jgi:hypothetical protein